MKLTKREVVLITFLLIAGLLYGTYAFLAKPLQNRYFEYVDEKARVEQQEMDLNLQLAQKPNLEKRLDEIKANIGNFSDVIIDPLVPELVSNYLLDQLADSNLTVDNISMGQVSELAAGALLVQTPAKMSEQAEPEAEADAVTDENSQQEPVVDDNTSSMPEGQNANQMTISISLSGRYSEIYQFLARLEDENRSLEVSNMSLGNIATEEDGADSLLSVSASLDYYEIELPEGYSNDDDPYTRPAFRLPEGKDQPFG